MVGVHYCRRCGQPVTGAWCGACGQPSDAAAAQDDRGRTSTAWMWAAISVSMAVLAGALVVVLVAGRGGQGTAAPVDTLVTDVTQAPTTTAPPPTTAGPTTTAPAPATSRPVATAPVSGPTARSGGAVGPPVVAGWYAVVMSGRTGQVDMGDLAAAAAGYGGEVVDTDDYLNAAGRPPDFLPAADVYAAVVGPFDGPDEVTSWCLTERGGVDCNVRQFVPAR